MAKQSKTVSTKRIELDIGPRAQSNFSTFAPKILGIWKLILIIFFIITVVAIIIFILLGIGVFSMLKAIF